MPLPRHAGLLQGEEVVLNGTTEPPPPALRLAAVHRPELLARVIARRALTCSDAASAAMDRPGHVRAGSSLSWLGGRLAVLQDDASFVALVDPLSDAVDSIALPPDARGRRLFDGKRGKAYKPDFECGVVWKNELGEILIALGSGSTARRESVAIVNAAGYAGNTEPLARIVQAASFYRCLRNRADFSGSELNIEGAVLLDDERLVLFQRGNGAPRAGLAAVNSTCEVPWPGLWRYLLAEGHEPPPEPHSIVNYDLGAIADVPLTFTDATMSPNPGVLLYVASAEDSPDTYLDGEVAGTGIGTIAVGVLQWGLLLGEDGQCLREKAEGLAFSRTAPDRLFVCIDPDDPSRPTELCEVELHGPWPWLV